jgi:hypothetical protein
MPLPLLWGVRVEQGDSRLPVKSQKIHVMRSDLLNSMSVEAPVDLPELRAHIAHRVPHSEEATVAKLLHSIDLQGPQVHDFPM